MSTPAFILLQSGAPSLLQNFTVRSVAGSVVILFVAWLLIRSLSKGMEALSRRSARARFFVKFLEPAVRIGIWFIALLICLSLLAPSRETFLAGIASLGIAIGLGAQATGFGPFRRLVGTPCRPRPNTACAFMSTFHGCHVSRPFGLHFHLTQPSLSE
jgi:hypothetical protein